MRSFVLLLLCGAIVVQLAGCTGPAAVKQHRPSFETAAPNQQSGDSIAAPSQQPGDSIAARLLAVLQTLSPEQALSQKDPLGSPGVSLACVGTAGAKPEQTVLACQWGQGYNAMSDGRTLAWREGGVWQIEPFPLEAVRGIAYFERLYRQGDDLIVVMNVAGGMTMGTEQVQVLHLAASHWQVAWLPEARAWTQGHATVSFIGSTFDRFTVDTDSYRLPDDERGPFIESNAGDHRPFREEWVKEPLGYVRLSRTEIPTEYGAVVHFVTALTNGDDAGAAQWAAQPELVSRAKALGIPGSAPKGYFTRREDSTAQGWGPAGPTFRLIANDEAERPQWLVKVKQAGERWLVSELCHTECPE